ncbi:MAG: hypothetical protein JO227_05720, partial [Acetobacteraceae bacterium]|nr:hypothetical protein [Acetobacteraceae bacterium]
MVFPASRLSRVILIALAFILSTPAAFAQLFPVCSWPFESNGRGLTNVATPDTHATYWIMPFDTASGSMVIHGMYPSARFFNFTSYTETGQVLDSVADSKIAPDTGSTNSFATPGAKPYGAYTLTIGAGTGGSSNRLSAGGTRIAFVVYRLYLPDMGLDNKGGVPLPTISLVASNGTVRELRPCPFADAETSLVNLVALLNLNGFGQAANFLQQILLLANQRGINTGLCNPAQPGPTAVTFAQLPAGGFFPNPQTTYWQTPGLCFQPGKILVIRGKASVFPNTYTGGSVFDPAFDGSIQLRYWSLCNNDNVAPYPVIACQADFETNRGADQFYTYVISNDQAPPAWLPVSATWLPWGGAALPKTLIFRATSEDNSQLS